MQRNGEAGQSQNWGAYNRTPEAQPQYQNQRPGGGTYNGSTYGNSGAGLERDYGARSRGFSRSSPFTVPAAASMAAVAEDFMVAVAEDFMVAAVVVGMAAAAIASFQPALLYLVSRSHHAL